MKKLINRPDAVVEEMVQGLASAYPGLKRLAGHTVIVRADTPPVASRKVAVISGGGSGHEPAHAGYVGHGMLSAAVAGDVFTSPSPDAVLAAIEAVSGPAGALLIVKNYTGDRLNFGLAAELAKAKGIPVEMVIVADDAALVGSTSLAGARGLAGTILVHKVAGAAAEAGRSLAEVAAEAQAAADSVATMGVALSPCTVPAAGKPGFSLAEDEVELGLGIHGEPGVRKAKIAPADTLVDTLLKAILVRLQPPSGCRVVLLVNNLGATPTMELAIAAREAIAFLEARDMNVERVYIGTFLSALEMAGISLSVMSVNNERLDHLDEATTAPAWPNAANHPRDNQPTLWPNASANPVIPPPPLAPTTALGRATGEAIRAVASALIAATERLTELDQVVGDGDLGISLARGANAVVADIPGYPLDDPATTLRDIGVTLQRALGGTSGPLYAMLFLAAGDSLKTSGSAGANLAGWADAFAKGIAHIGQIGGASVGERTMLDALVPASDAFSAAVRQNRPLAAALNEAATAAEQGAEATSDLIPRRGRSSYLGERALGNPDPGAVAVGVWLRALASFVSRLYSK